MTIKVKTNSIKNASTEIREVSHALSKADRAIERAIKSLDGSTSVDMSIRKSLNDAKDSVNKSASSISKMGIALETIANHYGSTEKSLVMNGLRVKRLIDGGSSKGNNGLSSEWLKRFFDNNKWLYYLGAMPGVPLGGAVLGLGIFILPAVSTKSDIFENLEIMKTTFSMDGQLSLLGKGGIFDPKLEAAAKAEFVALAAKTGYDAGLISGYLEGEVGKISAKGKATASLFDENGMLSPELEAKAVAEATLAEGKYSTKIGNDYVNAIADAEGKLFTAKAEASANISDEGFEVEAGAEAYAVKGEAKTELNFFGLKLELTTGGGLGGASATAGAKMTGTSVSGNIGLGLGLGLDIGFNLSWDKPENEAAASSDQSGRNGYSGGGGGGGGAWGR